jgi:hypothetical protein
MNLEQAKNICKAHVKYVLEDIPNDYTHEEIGIAIHTIAIAIKPIIDYNYKVLVQYNEWRRGYLQEYPLNTIYNMNILKESISLLQ